MRDDPWQDAPPPAPRRRWELVAAGAFAVLLVTVPLFITDLYPFSRAPMFSDAPRQCCDYHILAPDGTELPNLDFGVQRNYWGNPIGVGVGYRPPPTVDRFGEIATMDEVTTVVAARLNARGGPEYVDVVQEIIGAVDGDRVGVVERRRWRVERRSP